MRIFFEKIQLFSRFSPEDKRTLFMHEEGLRSYKPVVGKTSKALKLQQTWENAEKQGIMDKLARKGINVGLGKWFPCVSIS